MTKLVNRAKMTTATTGTGTITLGSAVDGYQAFTSAGVVNGDLVRYVIEDDISWEIGTGTFSSGTLTRTPSESSNGGAAISLSGQATVALTATADDINNVETATKLATARTISLSGDVTGSVSFDGSANANITAVVVDDSHNHIIANVDGLQAALDAKLDDTQKGAANGLAELDATGRVPAAQLPSYVDDVLEYASEAAFPATGEAGKIYVALDVNDIFRWSGTAYIKISDAVSSADQATKLATARTISLAGDVTGSTTFDGSANVTITAVVADDSHNHVISNVDGLQTALDSKLPLTGGTLSGPLTVQQASSSAQLKLERTVDSTGSAWIGADNTAFRVYDSSFSPRFYLPLAGGAAQVNGSIILDSSNYNSYSPTLTGGGASGTWGINTTGSSYSVNLGGTGNTITSSAWAGGGGYHGYTYSGGNYRFGFSSTGGVVDVYADGNFYATDSSHLVLHAGNYNSYSPTLTGGGASGTWGINITGNAATATSATSVITPTFSGDSVGREDITARTESGFYETSSGTTAEGWPRNDGAWQHMLAVTHSNDSNYYSMQLAAGFFSQNWYLRNTNGNGATGWSEVLTSSNYTNYPAPVGNGAVTRSKLSTSTGSLSFSTGSSGGVSGFNIGAYAFMPSCRGPGQYSLAGFADDADSARVNVSHNGSGTSTIYWRYINA